ncbi:MAG: xanthine phosphoribosyltransferase [Rhodospirillales bacterium]
MAEQAGPSKELIVSWAEVHRDTRHMVHRLFELGPWKGIVALTRGGLVPAAIIARELEIRVIDTLCIASYDETDAGELAILKLPADAVAADGEGWLVIDDLVDSGRTARETRRLLPKAYIATVYAKPDGLDATDLFVHDVPQATWVHFPWDTETRYSRPVAKGEE